MLKLDNNLLQELGLGSLPEDQKRAMLQHIYETLELRVGTNLANQMTDQQLEEFEQFIDSGGDANQAQALQWLESNLPNYKQVVNEVFEALKGEVKQMAPQIVVSSQQQAAAMPQGQAQATTPVPMTPQQQAYGQPPMPPTTAPQPAYAPPQQQYAQPQPAYQPPAAPVQQNPTQVQDFQAYQPMPGPQGMPQTFPAQVPVNQGQPAIQQPYPPLPPIGQNPQQSAAQQYTQPQPYQPAPPQNPPQAI